MRVISEDQRKALLAAFQGGEGIRAAARSVGISKQTAARYLRQLGTVPNCGCGAPITHQGWCAVRYAKSAPRQAFVNNWRSREMNIELDELCEWCFEKGRERPATSMLAGVPLCESCSNGKQTRFNEKKTALYEPESAATSPGRSIPVPKKPSMPQVEKIIVKEVPAPPAPELVKPKPVSLWDNHHPCKCGCGSPIENGHEWGEYIPDHQPKPARPASKWEECFKQIAAIPVGTKLTVRLPEGGTRSQMNSAVTMNSLTKAWRWSVNGHRDGTVTVKKLGDWATKDAGRLASYEKPEPKRKAVPEVKPPSPELADVLTIPLNRKPVVLVPGAQAVTQVAITPKIAQAVWESLTLAQKAELWDIEGMWNDGDDWLRMCIVSKILLVDTQ